MMDETERLRWIIHDYQRRVSAALDILRLMHAQANRHQLVIVDVSREVVDDLIRTLGGVVPTD